MELEEPRILTAAHLMVASLAGSLAHVTCKVLFYSIFSCPCTAIFYLVSTLLLARSLILSHIFFYICCLNLFFHDQEPLRTSILNQLRNSLQGLNLATDLLEQAVQIVTNDNLDLGCAVIEQAATDKVLLIYMYTLLVRLNSHMPTTAWLRAYFLSHNTTI